MRVALLLALAGCVPLGEEAPATTAPQPRQEEAVALILAAYDLSPRPVPISWVTETLWDGQCSVGGTFPDRGRCVKATTYPGPVFRVRWLEGYRYSITGLHEEMCRAWLADCSGEVTDRALNALFHAGL